MDCWYMVNNIYGQNRILCEDKKRRNYRIDTDLSKLFERKMCDINLKQICYESCEISYLFVTKGSSKREKAVQVFNQVKFKKFRARKTQINCCFRTAILDLEAGVRPRVMGWGI